MSTVRFKNKKKIIEPYWCSYENLCVILLKLHNNSVFIKFSWIVFVIISRLYKWGSRFFYGNISLFFQVYWHLHSSSKILSHLFYVTRTVNPKCTIECYAINYCTEYFAIRALPLKYHCSRLELKWFFCFLLFLHWAFYLISQYIN